MNPEQAALYRRLLEFQFDPPGATARFAARLAKENGWTIGYSHSVLIEYRRFLFLSIVAGHPVSPSPDVDEAWHLHLTYSRSYWRDLCGTVLGRELHHDPSTGGETEAAKFESWYAQTLDSYQKYFSEPPPENIWPRPTVRKFGSHAHHSAICMAFVAPFGSMFGNPMDLPGPDFLMLYVLLLVVGTAVAWLIRSVASTNQAHWQEDAIVTPTELAFLSHGSERVVDTVLSELLRREAIMLELSVDAQRDRFEINHAQETAPTDELEAVVLDLIRAPGSDMSSVRTAAVEVAERIGDRLRARGLVTDPQRSRYRRTVAACILFLIALLGIAKIVVGIERERPVLFQVGLTVLAFAVGRAFLHEKCGRPTRLGRAILERYRRLVRPGSIHGPYEPLFDGVALGNAVAILGLPALAGTRLEDLRVAAERHAKTTNTSSGSVAGCGTGSGDGGGAACGAGCGGGCGGCGG